MWWSTTMKCPFCGYTETKVVDKREQETTDIIRRRRECLQCEKRFTTYERIENVILTVIKKDNSRERFDKQKLKLGILKACEKRPVPDEKIEQIIEDIELELRTQDSTEIPSKVIGDLVSKKLRKLDKVAYIRFASVYKEFEDIDELHKEIIKLIK